MLGLRNLMGSFTLRNCCALGIALYCAIRSFISSICWREGPFFLRTLRSCTIEGGGGSGGYTLGIAGNFSSGVCTLEGDANGVA